MKGIVKRDSGYSAPFISTLFEIMNGTDRANALPCGMGNAGFWRYGNSFPTASPSHMAELQTSHWQQAEGMETQAKSFVADGAKCHHLRHGFSQCWEIMEGVLRCQDCHHPFPLPAASAFPEIIPVSHRALIWPMLLEVLHKHCIINVMPSSVSRGSDGFCFSSTIRWTGKMKR